MHVPRNPWTHTDGWVEFAADEDVWNIKLGHVRHSYRPERLREVFEEAGFKIDHQDLWLRRYGVRAFQAYERLEHPAPLRLLSLPVTEVCSGLDRHRRGRGRGSVRLTV